LFAEKGGLLVRGKKKGGGGAGADETSAEEKILEACLKDVRREKTGAVGGKEGRGNVQ